MLALKPYPKYGVQTCDLLFQLTLFSNSNEIHTYSMRISVLNLFLQ